ncbi:MAG: hypothetical protein KDB96_15160 [Flavobacteriales bacterium]|nr:hypothetical protein [Flavobacteriales bacterium]MCB9179482.1 hypothetical protein [Flavobacteriales bacterium]
MAEQKWSGTVDWADLEPLLKPHAMVSNGRELHWVGWCWQILEHIGLTKYESEAELSAVLMRSIALLAVQEQYASLILRTGGMLDGSAIFQELCASFGCGANATLAWEVRRIMEPLLEAYRSWDPLVPRYVPVENEEIEEWSGLEGFLEDLRHTLPAPDRDEMIHPWMPEAFAHGMDEPSLEEYQKLLPLQREHMLDTWVESDFLLSAEAISNVQFSCNYWLFFHMPWEEVQEIIKPFLCWGSAEELGWYEEMWELLRLSGYTGFQHDEEEVCGTVVRLVELYQTFCKLALDRPLALDPEAWYAELLKEEYFLSVANDPYDQVPAVLPVLIRQFAQSPGMRHRGRFGSFTPDPVARFRKRLEATLPIDAPSLARHYESRNAWRFDAPAGTDLETYNRGLWEQRSASIDGWLREPLQAAD